MVVLLGGSLLASGCDQLGALGAKSDAKPDKSEDEKKDKEETKKDEAATERAAAPASAKPILPPGRSTVPTLDEWNAIQKEVTVKGSSALNCETKMVREWLRISCRGHNDTGGTPTGLRVTRGGRGEEFTFASGGVTSLVMPFVDGTNFEAVFSWTDKSHKLVASWPHGAPKPVVIATFEGAASPLDGTAGNQALADKLCACHKKVRKEPTCDGMLGMPDADCDRTYGSDCAMLLACSFGEPGAWPTCRAGFKNGGVIGRCMRDCSGGKSCPAGTTCQKDWGEVCMPDN